MIPIDFKESNTTYAEDQPEYLPLPVYKYEDGTVISCWKFSFWERLKVLWTGKLWWRQLTFNEPLQAQSPSVNKWDQFDKKHFKNKK